VTEGEPWESADSLRDFAVQFVRTGNATLAVQQARVVNPQYRVAIWAEKLLKRSDVQEYVGEARAAGVDKPRSMTREIIADDLQEVYERALHEGAYAPAVSAKKTQAEVLGLLEKNVRVTFGRDVKELSMEDLERELARLQSDGVIELLPSGVNEEGVQVYE
jgi:hypothetical protein